MDVIIFWVGHLKEQMVCHFGERAHCQIEFSTEDTSLGMGG